MNAPRAAFAVCLLLVVAYGALLRLDALVSGYRAPAHPRWIAALCKVTLARYVEPNGWRDDTFAAFVTLTLWAIGLALMTGWADGRLTIVTTIAAVAPYALTWNVGSGGEWRFTAHVYSTLLAGAAVAITGFWSRRPINLRPVASCAVLLAIGTGTYRQLPWWVQRENLRRDGATSLEAGARDTVFFRSGWSRPHGDGDNVTSRVSLGARRDIDAPLPAEGTYFLTVRCDPVSPGDVREVALLWNGILPGRFRSRSIRHESARIA